MNKYLPSKRFSTIGGACLAALVLILVADKLSFGGSAAAQNGLVINLATSTAAQAKFDTIDTDKDGLPDWKEVLLRTNPKNADTDDDKTLDGEEVTLHRDPTKAGPNDQVAQSAQAGNGGTSTGTSTTKLTHTDELARQIFGQYLEITNGGKEKISTEDLNALVQGAAEHATNFDLEIATYSTVDIRRGVDSSDAALRTYLNTFAKAIQESGKTVGESSLTIAFVAITNQDMGGLQKIDANIAADQALIDQLKKITVPPPLVTLHVNLLNQISSIKSVDMALRNADKDIAYALATVSQYQEISKNFFSAFIAIRDFYITRGLTFGINEPGGQWLTILKNN